MPTYDYKCNNCGSEFEIKQSMSENPKRKCQTCGKMTLERLISIPSHVHVKKGSSDMKTVGDLAQMNRDTKSSLERQKIEHDMSQESRIANSRINQKIPDWLDMGMQKKIKKMKTKKQIDKFIETGATPSDTE